MKKDDIYRALLPLRVAAFEEIVSIARAQNLAEASSKYIFTKYVYKLIKEGRLCRIQKGLYGVLGPLDDPAKYLPDKFLVGAKIRKGGFLGYHTALELHGCAYSAFYNTVYVCVRQKDRFDPLTFRGLMFKPAFVRDVDLGTEKVEYLGQTIKVAGKERTFIDCLDRPRYAGGWEECLKSLQALGGLDFKKLFMYLSKRQNKFLLRKVGFALELLKKNSVFYEHLEEEQLEALRRRARGTPSYLEPKRGVLNEDWCLYVPEGFEEKVLRGV